MVLHSLRWWWRERERDDGMKGSERKRKAWRRGRPEEKDDDFWCHKNQWRNVGKKGRRMDGMVWIFIQVFMETWNRRRRRNVFLHCLSLRMKEHSQWKKVLWEKNLFFFPPSGIYLSLSCMSEIQTLSSETFFSFCFLDSTKVKGRRPRKWRGRRKWWKEDEEWMRKEWKKKMLLKHAEGTIESHSVTRFFFVCPEKFQECWKGYTKCFRAVSSHSIPFSPHFPLFFFLLSFCYSSFFLSHTQDFNSLLFTRVKLT